MIKVIKHGTKHRIECHSCKAILTYEDEDVIFVPDMGAIGFGYHYIVCPDCNEQLITDSLIIKSYEKEKKLR